MPGDEAIFVESNRAIFYHFVYTLTPIGLNISEAFGHIELQLAVGGVLAHVVSIIIQPGTFLQPIELHLNSQTCIEANRNC